MNGERKAIDLTDQELEDASLVGQGSAWAVREIIQAARKRPASFDWLTLFQLECVNISTLHRASASASPILPTSSHAMSISQLNNMPAVEQDLISRFEKARFYDGISDDPPELLYRSDLATNPFVVITKGTFSVIPEKTVHGAFNAILNPIWRDTVAPAIIALLKEEKRGIRLSTLMPVRFSTPDDDGKPVFGPIVIWISVHPNTTTAVACRDASPEILHLLESKGVKGAAVHWYEGSVEPLSGPSMMGITYSFNPTSYIRRALTAVLGLPLAAEAMASDDSQISGSAAFFFHEGQDTNGGASERVFGVTANHVVRKVTNVDYELRRNSAVRSYVRVCGARRFQDMVNETRNLISDNVNVATSLIEVIEILEAKAVAGEADQVDEYAYSLKWNRHKLEKAKVDNIMLERFFKDINANWSDALQRTIGWVDWAPRIRKDVDSRAYTLDIATVELEKSKWKKEFKGNFVYLGSENSAYDMTTRFCPNAARPPSFEYPPNHLLRILGFVTADQLAKPVPYEEQGDAPFIVAKDGQSTDLTFGRYSALEAYTCDKFNHCSWEVPVFNYNSKSRNFAAKGDSGSLIFNAGGKMVAVLHSGMPRGSSSHVSFATPAHFVLEQIKLRYPNADFDRLEF